MKWTLGVGCCLKTKKILRNVHRHSCQSDSVGPFSNPKAEKQHDVIKVMETNSPLNPTDVIQVAMTVKQTQVDCACLRVCARLCSILSGFHTH